MRGVLKGSFWEAVASSDAELVACFDPVDELVIGVLKVSPPPSEAVASLREEPVECFDFVCCDSVVCFEVVDDFVEGVLEASISEAVASPGAEFGDEFVKSVLEVSLSGAFASLGAELVECSDSELCLDSVVCFDFEIGPEVCLLECLLEVCLVVLLLLRDAWLFPREAVPYVPFGKYKPELPLATAVPLGRIVELVARLAEARLDSMSPYFGGA